jgi:26S proteasome regulatory subunit N9
MLMCCVFLRLWHQLSIALEKFLQNNLYQNWNVNSLELYDKFISQFENRLSPVRFAIIVSLVGRSFQDPAESVNFYDRILSQLKGKLTDAATRCITMDVAVAKLRLGQLEETKKLLEEGNEKLRPLASSESIVFSKYYSASAEYRKVAGPPQEFYKSALMFLAYTSVEELEPQQRYELATDLALAAATGEGIYNFGEVITNPILLALRDSPNSWLYDLVMILNAGDIDGFNSLIDKQRTAYFGQPALAAMHEDVKKKIVFMCLLNIVFERHSHDRTISFNIIAERTRLPYQEVLFRLAMLSSNSFLIIFCV